MKRVFVAGHNGMVGSAIVRMLSSVKNIELVTASRHELDLINQQEVFDFYKQQNIDEVYLAAAKVGGIQANNSFPADFIYQNLMMQSNVIHGAYTFGVKKLLFLGSSCIYPKYSSHPISEEALLSGSLEPTNEPYAIAKIAGIKTCESFNRQYGCDFRSIMPTNLYGLGDNFHPENSHVIPAMLKRFHEAKLKDQSEVVVWGSGKPMREFLYVDDMANASVHVMDMKREQYNSITAPQLSHINVGSGIDCTIAELAQTIADVVGFQGDLYFDTSKPDGTLRKLMDSTKLRSTGWSPENNLKTGLEKTYNWFLTNQAVVRES